MRHDATQLTRAQCLAPGRVDAPVHEGSYRLMFEDLPPLVVDEEALHALGRPGGPCDRDGERADDTDSRVPAVWPFFGQFIAHDITADRSPPAHRADPATDPQLPRTEGEPREPLRRGSGRLAVPVQRGRPRQAAARADGERRAAQPRGDRPRRGPTQRRAALHRARWSSAFIGLHNRLVDCLRDDAAGDGDVFARARRAATWHYQHVILREFLTGLVGVQLTADLLADGPRLSVARPGSPHPAGVRRRRVSLRPRPDPRPLSGQRATSDRARCSRTSWASAPSRPSTPSTGHCRSTSRATPPPSAPSASMRGCPPR